MGVAQQKKGADIEEDSLDRLTEDEVHAIVSCGVRVQNPEHAYFFAEIGYGRAAAVVSRVIEEYFKQINGFIEGEDSASNGFLGKRKVGVADSTRLAEMLSREEYAELIHSDQDAYNERFAAWREGIAFGEIGRKQASILDRNRSRQGHFRGDDSSARNLFDYNTRFFTFDNEGLAVGVREVLGITGQGVPSYMHEFEEVVESFAVIARYLQNGAPFSD